MYRRAGRLTVENGGFLPGQNGHNSLEESDASVMHLCPVCLRKLQSNAGFDVLARYQASRGR